MEAHYRNRGAQEQRIASLTRAMRLAKLTVRDLPLGFVLADYTSIYPDLVAAAATASSARCSIGAGTGARSGG